MTMKISTPMLLISSSYVVDEEEYLGYCRQELRQFLKAGSRLLFVPFAYKQHDKYTKLARTYFESIGVEMTSAHEAPPDSAKAIREAYDAVFCGGGNTFLLLAELYKRGLIVSIREAVQDGVRYMGSSAGANVACPTIGTTNDMPIVQPTSLKGLALIPFNINPHYFDWPDSVKHMGETPKDRIREFLDHNAVDVLALREGAMLLLEKGEARLGGRAGGRVFRRDRTGGQVIEKEVASRSSVTFLLRES